MLILSRRPGDVLLIDGGIRVVVVGIEGGSVRLGIEAPRGVGIVREEVALRIAEENRRAGTRPEDRSWVAALGGAPSGKAPGEVSPPPPDEAAPEGA